MGLCGLEAACALGPPWKAVTPCSLFQGAWLPSLCPLQRYLTDFRFCYSPALGRGMPVGHPAIMGELCQADCMVSNPGSTTRGSAVVQA